ncbi:unnamed protein product [Hydatigera taeniaeformis]|uniref:Kinesin motor domain-containing protein n=1 Tax=Hydatigena taeniaeformis TaxID=6205 RepID=A0A0R3X200_HYDTA|nr:unnamed protein product [Hydatigera taeniaeformis]
MASQGEAQSETPVQVNNERRSSVACENSAPKVIDAPQDLTVSGGAEVGRQTCCANQTSDINNDSCLQCSSCQEFTTLFPFSYNIFVPATDSSIHHFMKLRHKLTTTYLRCRLRMGVNTFDSGCIYGNERLLRVESQTEEELIQAIDRLDEVIPAWKVWQRGKVDSQLIR